MTTITEYSYQDLAAKAMAADATQEDLNNLGTWFDRYGSAYWNGEYYEIDSSHRLFPVDQEDGDGNYQRIGWEIR